MEQTEKGIYETKLEEHSHFCEGVNPQQGWHTRCHNTKFIFLAFNKYFIVHYPQCWDYDHLDMKQMIIESVCGKVRTKQNWNFRRSIHLDKKFTDFRRRQLELNEKIDYIHFTYFDNAYRKYGITSKVDLMDRVFNDDELKNNTIKAKEYVLSREDLKHFKEDIEDLASENYIGYVDTVNVIKTTDELIKQIKQLTK
jgi:hypothetical protein